MKLKVKILDSHHTLYHKCRTLHCDRDLYAVSDPKPRTVSSNRLNYLANDLGKENVYLRVLDTTALILYSGAHEVILDTEEEIWNWNKFLSFSDIKC